MYQIYIYIYIYIYIISEAYSEPCQTSKMELFTKIVNGYEPLAIFAWQSCSEYAFVYIYIYIAYIYIYIYIYVAYIYIAYIYTFIAIISYQHTYNNVTMPNLRLVFGIKRFCRYVFS